MGKFFEGRTVTGKFPALYSNYIREALSTMRDDCLKNGPVVESKLTSLGDKVELQIAVSGTHDVDPVKIALACCSYIDGYLCGKGIDVEYIRGNK